MLASINFILITTEISSNKNVVVTFLLLLTHFDWWGGAVSMCIMRTNISPEAPSGFNQQQSCSGQQHAEQKKHIGRSPPEPKAPQQDPVSDSVPLFGPQT